MYSGFNYKYDHISSFNLQDFLIFHSSPDTGAVNYPWRGISAALKNWVNTRGEKRILKTQHNWFPSPGWAYFDGRRINTMINLKESRRPIRSRILALVQYQLNYFIANTVSAGDVWIKHLFLIWQFWVMITAIQLTVITKYEAVASALASGRNCISEQNKIYEK